MTEYAIRPLDAATWDDFVHLAERHNGLWNGCWCTWFHPACTEKGESFAGNRAYKERLVREGKAHAALVFDSDVAVAWCEYGSPNKLPNIYHPKEYNAGLDKKPDYRLTCFFVARNYRRKGVAAVALRGALELQAVAGPSSSVNERPSRALGPIPKLLARGGSQMREPGGLDHAAPRWTVADSCTVSDRDGAPRRRHQTISGRLRIRRSCGSNPPRRHHARPAEECRRRLCGRTDVETV